jgi:hypothetical protein
MKKIILINIITMSFYEDLDLIFNNDSLLELKIKVIEAYEKNSINKSNYIAKSIISSNFKILNGQIIVV